MKNSRGFTLVEVLVAAAVLGIVATALFGLLGKSLSNLQKVERLHRYELAAQDVMNRVLLLSSLPPSGMSEGSIDNLGGTWAVKIEPWATEKVDRRNDIGIVKVRVQVSWPGRSNRMSIELESLKAAKIEDYDLQSRIATSFPQ